MFQNHAGCLGFYYGEMVQGNLTESRSDSLVHFTDRSGEPLEGGLSRAVETLYGKEGAQGKVSVFLGVAGIFRACRRGE